MRSASALAAVRRLSGGVRLTSSLEASSQRAIADDDARRPASGMQPLKRILMSRPTHFDVRMRRHAVGDEHLSGQICHQSVSAMQAIGVERQPRRRMQSGRRFAAGWTRGGPSTPRWLNANGKISSRQSKRRARRSKFSSRRFAVIDGCSRLATSLQGADDLPDLVFCANAATIRNKTAYLSNFHHAERQGERAHYKQWFEANGYKTVGSTEFAFEGERRASIWRSKVWRDLRGGRRSLGRRGSFVAHYGRWAANW